MLFLLLIISIMFNIGFCYLIRILLIKNSIYENWVINFKSKIEEVLEEMRSIDKEGVFSTGINEKGIFESDDQVGFIFKQLLDLLENLNNIIQ